MIAKTAVALLFVFFGLPGTGRAQAPPGPEDALTLEQCLRIGLESNPSVLASAARFEAARARIKQAGALAQPSLGLDSDLQPRPFDFKGSGESYLGIGQVLQFPGRRSLRVREASGDADASFADIELVKLDLTFQIKSAFYELLAAGERVQYAGLDLELARDFAAKAEAKLKAGDMAEVEVLRARVEASKATGALKVAENERRLAAVALSTLLARNPRERLEIRGPMKGARVAVDPESLVARALLLRPEARRLAAEEKAQAARTALARMSALPDFDLGLARHRISGEPQTWDFTLTVSVPVFFWQPKAGAIAEAEAGTREIARELDRVRDTIRKDVEEAALNMVSARDQIDLFEREILQPAQEVYDAFLYRFEKGEIGGIELIEARRSLMEARRSYADALLNYQITLAFLERSVGGTLEGAVDAK